MGVRTLVIVMFEALMLESREPSTDSMAMPASGRSSMRSEAQYSWQSLNRMSSKRSCVSVPILSALHADQIRQFSTRISREG